MESFRFNPRSSLELLIYAWFFNHANYIYEELSSGVFFPALSLSWSPHDLPKDHAPDHGCECHGCHVAFGAATLQPSGVAPTGAVVVENATGGWMLCKQPPNKFFSIEHLTSLTVFPSNHLKNPGVNLAFEI